MDMNDIVEQDKFYFRKRQETLKRILGDRHFSVSDDITTRVEVSDSRPWHEKTRILNSMSGGTARDQRYVSYVNRLAHENGAKMVLASA